VDVLVDGNSLVENETGQDIVGHRGDGEISRLRVGVVCGDDGNFGSVVTRDRERDAVIPVDARYHVSAANDNYHQFQLSFVADGDGLKRRRVDLNDRVLNGDGL